MRQCECCDHPLQHAIRAVIARYEAPIPAPSAAELVSELQHATAMWEDSQEATPPEPRAAARREGET